MIPVDLGWLPRRRRPVPPAVPPRSPVPESAPQPARPLIPAGRWPDPLVFGPEYERHGPRGAFMQSCPCGVQWGSDETVCWNCGTKATS